MFGSFEVHLRRLAVIAEVVLGHAGETIGNVCTSFPRRPRSCPGAGGGDERR